MSNGAKLSMLISSLTILFMAALLSGVIKSDHWEMQNIILQAEFKRVNSEQVRVIVAAYPERSFFKFDAGQLREQIIKVPWVEQVYVNKKWPNSIIIKVIEHAAVAVWNDDKLLNEKGEIFAVDSIDDLSALPHINAQDSQSRFIWDKYVRFNDILKQTGLNIDTTTVSNRGGWNIFLSNGINLNIGSQYIDSKLVRLVETWESLLQKNEYLPIYIDLRYPNGYVVKWPVIEQDNQNEPEDKLEDKLENKLEDKLEDKPIVDPEYITSTAVGIIHNNG